MAIRFDYSRRGRQMSLPGFARTLFNFFAAALVLLLATLFAAAQYPGQVAKNAKESPELRAIAVLEWTGEAGKPKASRLVPVTVLDQGELQDGGIYLARPEPLSLTGEVEYELEQDGKPVGLFDIRNAGQEQGSWVGYGAWKPLPAAKPRPSAQELARSLVDQDDAQSDEPVLHRKHYADDAPASGTGSGSGTGSQAQDSDPDRPTLHKKASSDSTSDSGSSTNAGTASTTGSSSNPASDPDQPTLHRKDSSDSASGNSDSGSGKTDDPDRSVLKKSKKKPEDVGHVDSLPDVTDPDRPRLKRGKSGGSTLDVVPSLMGLPPDMQQAVAVSDAKSRPEHPWNYSWANPDDEAKLKSAMEDVARNALGLNQPPPPPHASAPKKTRARKNAAPPPAPPEPAPLIDEQFRVFELAYGSGATLVLSARTDGPAAEQKFVTLVAQPDLYGNLLVLLKNVTDGAHLDETPRMRLVDAVDAMADNRGELLFELRGATQRQFALYRVLRGQTEKLFASGGGEFVAGSGN